MRRIAIIAHLFYPDLSRALLDRLRVLDIEFDLFVTGPIDDDMRRYLSDMGRPVEFVPTGRAGFDVAPFLDALEVVSGRGYEFFCKVHTKRGDFAFGERWREECLDAVIGSSRIVQDIVAGFESNECLAIAGPAALYVSAVVNMLGNSKNVEALAELCYPGSTLPDDWGFFAGTMFWGRTRSFSPFLGVRRKGSFPEGLGRADGHPEHALERLFGLAGWPSRGRIGLIEGAGHERRLQVGEPEPRALPIHRILARLGRPRGGLPPGEEEARLISRANPLLHYLRAGRAADIDPNELFNNRWYLAANPDLSPTSTPLADFMSRGSATFPPSPLFDAGDYSYRKRWLARLGVNPLADFLERARSNNDQRQQADGAEQGPDRQGAGTGPSGQSVSIAIKIAARRMSDTTWGDTAFAEGLATALEHLGHRPTIQFRDEWYQNDGPFDYVIVLRGPARYTPQPGSFNILWNISHPDQVTLDEMELYDRVFVASESYCRLLSTTLRVPVSTLPQATDATRFFPGRRGHGDKVLFVGNSRGDDRKIVRWAIEEELAPEIIGAGWEDLAPPQLVAAKAMDNRLLRERYAMAGAVLNDHWPAMRAFGFVSNRLFDVLAAGGVPVSDDFPAVRRIFGSAVMYARDSRGVRRAVGRARQRSDDERRRKAAAVIRLHSFDERAGQLVADILTRVGAGRPGAAKRSGVANLHVLLPPKGAAWGDLTFSRLVLTLTQDSFGEDLQIQFGTADQLSNRPHPSTLLVSSEALGDPATVELLSAAAAAGTRTIIDEVGFRGAGDNGMSPGALQPSRALFDASELWLSSTPPGSIQASGAKVRIMPNSIDQRVWRNFHGRHSFADAPRKLRVLILCRHGDAWAKDLLAAAGRLPHGGMEYVVVGSGARALLGDRARRTWVKTHEPLRSQENYLQRAAWLRAQPQFHVGICSPNDDVDRRFLEFSALGAVAVLPGQMAAFLADAGRGIAILTDGTLAGTLAAVDQIARDALPFEAIAAAARNHVWSHRNAADVAKGMRIALDQAR